MRCLRNAISTFLLMACFAISGALHAQQALSSTIGVRIVPEVKLVTTGEALQITIRLNRGSTARIWTSDDCSPSSSPSELSRSGIYELPLGSLPGNGSRICLESSDGTLRTSTAFSRLPQVVAVDTRAIVAYP